MKEQTTWSPGATRVTPGPTPSTTPAPSCPSTMGSQPAISPFITCRSEWQSPACVKRTRTSPSWGPSRSSSSISRALPASWITAAVVFILYSLARTERPSALPLDGGPVDLGDAASAQQDQNGLDLLPEQVEHLVGPLLARRGDP